MCKNRSITLDELEKINNETGINNIIEGIISADKSMNLSDAKEAISKHQATL